MERKRARQILTADKIFDLVREDLRGVARAVDIESIVSADTVTPIADYLQQNDGEHLRAALLLLCTRFAGGNGGGTAIRLGAVVEMLHAATLVHDGVNDTEPMSRHRSSAHLQGTNCTSVLAGDWLYLRAFAVALQERVLDKVIGVAQMMVAGELIQLNHMGCIGMTENDCMDLADRKTAGLFSVCGRLGALAAGASTQDEDGLSEFAWNLGMAFQLIEDTLDFVCHESMPGKPAGGDLKDGKITLPLAYALQQASAAEQDLVAGVLRDRGYGSISFKSVQALVDRHGGIQRTHARAGQFADRARQILSELPENPLRPTLFSLTELVTDRGHFIEDVAESADFNKAH